MPKTGVDPASLARGRTLKRWNALTAIVCGGIPALLLFRALPASPVTLIYGFVAGLIWANGFEYVYHRCLLHNPPGGAFRRHLLHHASVGLPHEPEHVTLGGSPVWIAVLFLVNGSPVVLADLWLHFGFVPGMLWGFVVYVIVVEDVHWRIHLNEWLPGPLASARAHHLLHHERADVNYNIFAPVWDRMLHTLTSR